MDTKPRKAIKILQPDDGFKELHNLSPGVYTASLTALSDGVESEPTEFVFDIRK